MQMIRGDETYYPNGNMNVNLKIIISQHIIIASTRLNIK